MNSKVRLIVVVMLAGVVSAQFAYAEVTPKDIFKQCQSNAKEDLIPLGHLEQYLHQCMEDAGVESADVDSTMQEMMPAPQNSDDSQPASDGPT